MEKKIVYNKERGIKGCIADGWKMLALNWKDYLKQTWAYVLFAGLANAFFIEMLLQYVCEQALPAYLLLTSEGGDAQTRYHASPRYQCEPPSPSAYPSAPSQQAHIPRV